MGYKLCHLFFLTILVVIFYNGHLFSQQIPTPPQDDFLIGTFCASINGPYQEYILTANYDTMLICGLNSVWQKVKWQDPHRNVELLNQFKFVYAANDTAPQHAIHPNDKDWVSYFTHAKYSRWEAEGDEYFPADPQDVPGNIRVGVRHNNVGYETSDGWCSGTGNAGAFFIDGPYYSQYLRYTYTNRNYPSPKVDYNAVFSLKMETIPENITNVAEIMVTLYDTLTHQEIATLADMIISSDELSTNEYSQNTLSYNYQNYIEDDPNLNSTDPPLPGSNQIPMIGLRDSPWFAPSKRIRFKVRALTNNIPITVDYVEVYDAGQNGIYQNYFIEDYPTMISEITSYLQNYSGLTSNLYFGTLDEPLSWDSYLPIRKVQHILDSLQTGKNLLVHFGPQWNGKNEGLPVITRWVDIAQPYKLMFWYFPFSMNEDGIKWSTDFTLYQLRNILSQASYKQPGFFVTLQSGGVYSTALGRYKDYYKPSPEQLSAETMLSLSHGVKGIYYEEYYSYNTGSGQVRCLVDVPENGFAPTTEWYKVQSIAARMSGIFGQTYMKLNYMKDTLLIRRNILPEEVNTGETESNNYLTLSTNIGESTPPTYNFHAGFFNYQADNNYFLLTNLTTDAARTINITVGKPVQNFINIRFRNIEPGYNFDI